MPRAILDYYLSSRRVDVRRAWEGPLDLATLERRHTNEVALALARDALETGAYHDVHCWVFTPVSFTHLMRGLAELDLVKFSCESIAETLLNQNEFYATMTRGTNRQEIIATWAQATDFLEGSAGNAGVLGRLRRAWSSLTGSQAG